MSNENLELKLKLWNHLAQHGNLICSEAWYETFEQADQWIEMTKRELKNPKTNAAKEVALITELFKRPEIRNAYENQQVVIVDLGSGTGQKAAELIKTMPPAHIAYLPVDNSDNLLVTTHLAIRAMDLDVFTINPRLSLESIHQSLTGFLELIDNKKYDFAFHPLLHVYDLATRKASSIYTSLEFRRFSQETDMNWELTLEEIIAKLAKHTKEIKNDVIEFSKANLPPHEMKEKALALREKHQPEIADDALNNLLYFETMLNNYARKIITYSEILDAAQIVADYFGVKTPLQLGKKEKFESDIATKLDIPYTPGTRHVETIFPGIHSEFISGSLNEVDQTFRIMQKIRPEAKRLVCLLGQTLGNFKSDDQQSLIRSIYWSLSHGDALLLGVELTPNKEHPDYDLDVYRMELRYGGSRHREKEVTYGVFSPEPDKFLRNTTRALGIKDEDIQYHAEFKDNDITMFYEVVNQRGITLPHPQNSGQTMHFKKGYKIPVAISHKFKQDELKTLLESQKFKIEYFPDRTDYAVVLARK
jgi:uncharacterized SAM-dependent methyltransferase